MSSRIQNQAGILLGTVICTGAGLTAWIATHAGDPVTSGPDQPVQAPFVFIPPHVRLSEIAPGLLADFVRGSGKDREVSFLTSGLMGGGLSIDAWAAQVTTRLGIANTDAVTGPVWLMPNATAGSQKQSSAIAGTDVRLSSGKLIHQGGRVTTARAECSRGVLCEPVFILGGLIINGGEDPIDVRDSSGAEHMIGAGGSLFVGTSEEAAAYLQQVEEGLGGVAGSCSAQCESGYYACCTYSPNNTNPKCKCNLNSTQANCDAGGPGATTCSLAM